MGQGPVPPGSDGHVQEARTPGQREHRGQDRGPRVRPRGHQECVQRRGQETRRASSTGGSETFF